MIFTDIAKIIFNAIYAERRRVTLLAVLASPIR